MLYVVSMTKYYDTSEYYIFFETHTESFFSGDKAFLNNLIIVHKINIKNISVINGELDIKPWYNEIHCKQLIEDTGSDYVLICKPAKNIYKLVSYDKKISYVEIKQLKRLIQGFKIANCDFRDGTYKSMDTYTTAKDTTFEERINNIYKKYKTKTSILGCGMEFEYTIEGAEVKLRKYTGTCKNVIVPKFITTIIEGAFIGTEIESIKLEPGLKYIGSFAFEDCNLSEIMIPETVEFIGLGAFYGNKRLFKSNEEYTDKIKILNKRTLVLDKCTNCTS